MGHRLLIGIAAFIVIVAGLKAAAGLVVPFLMAAFIAILCAPPLAWMKRRRIPSTLSIVVVMLAAVLLLLTLGTLLNTSLTGFTEQLPGYQERLQQRLIGAQQQLAGYGLALPQEVLNDAFNPSAVLEMIRRAVSGFGGVVSNVFMVLITLLLILLEASSFPQKLRQIAKYPAESGERAQRVIDSINRYMAIKVLTSLATGILVWLWLWFLGIDFPILWGLSAFLLNFVPTIGSIIAAIPPVLLAVIQAGFGDAVLVASGYLVINFLIGNLLEPNFMGRNLGLSTLVVFLSLVFWGWVLGPVGMILSVPLTMTLKLAMENNPDTEAIAIMLGAGDDAPSGMAGESETEHGDGGRT